MTDRERLADLRGLIAFCSRLNLYRKAALTQFSMAENAQRERRRFMASSKMTECDEVQVLLAMNLVKP
jgi:hypothetical protein